MVFILVWYKRNLRLMLARMQHTIRFMCTQDSCDENNRSHGVIFVNFLNLPHFLLCGSFNWFHGRTICWPNTIYFDLALNPLDVWSHEFAPHFFPELETTALALKKYWINHNTKRKSWTTPKLESGYDSMRRF